MFEPFEMLEGTEIRIITEWDFRDENQAADWSVTAWSQKGKISLRHDKGYESHEGLPYIEEK